MINKLACLFLNLRLINKVHFEVHFVGYLYIMDLINARKL